MVSTIIFGILLLITAGTGVYMISNLQSEVRANRTKIETITTQASEKDAASQALQSKYNSLESDYRKLQTANTQTSTAPTSSASRCESKYLYSSNKYVTTCN